MPSTSTKKATKKSQKKPAKSKGNGRAARPKPATSIFEAPPAVAQAPRPRPTIQELPGMERERDPELERVGSLYDHRKNERLAVLEEEKELKQQLIQMMDERKLANYKMDDGRIIHIEPSESLKIIKPDDDD